MTFMKCILKFLPIKIQIVCVFSNYIFKLTYFVFMYLNVKNFCYKKNLPQCI